MKWIIRSSRTGFSRWGAGAPTASGAKNFAGVLCHPIEGFLSFPGARGAACRTLDAERLSRDIGAAASCRCIRKDALKRQRFTHFRKEMERR
jgi:hypothetical protein